MPANQTVHFFIVQTDDRTNRAINFLKMIKKIMVVDDDEDDRTIITEALNDIDDSIQCIHMDLAIDAIQYLKRNGTQLPDLILLDLNLPMMNGKEFLQILKQEPGLMHIPVVIISTSKLKQDMEDTKLLGAAHFIVKPSSYEKLEDDIRQVFQNAPDLAIL
jgi:CheY-like chemotaxis protein